MKSLFFKINRLAMTVDALLIALSLLCTSDVYAISEVDNFVSVLALALCVWILMTFIVRLYSPHTPRNDFDAIITTSIAIVPMSVSIFIGNAMADSVLIPGFNPFIFGLFFLCATTLFRILVIQPLSRKSKSDVTNRVIIIGIGSKAAATYEYLTKSTKPRHHVVGFLAFQDEQVCEDNTLPAPILGISNQILSVLSAYHIDEIYVAGNLLTQPEEIRYITNVCEEVGTPFAIPIHHLNFRRASLTHPTREGDGYLHYFTAQSKPIQATVKRLIDVTASFCALVVLSPLLVAVAIAIKLTSRGPILFRQERVGLHGSRFNLLKFRSMVVNAEKLKDALVDKNEQTGPVFKMQNDPRISTVGRFIRKYSIDELPQLINILRGEMSIVGPRPALPSEVVQYEPWQRRRLCVRPGLTCYWQISGRNNIGFNEWMRLDLQYIDEWSIALDFELIVRTVPAVLVGNGAS